MRAMRDIISGWSAESYLYAGLKDRKKKEGRIMRTLKSDFMDILENQRIRPVFQPIISLNSGEVIGYEALSRIIDPREISYSEEKLQDEM